MTIWPLKDYQASIEKLRKDAAGAALIRNLVTDKTKREMYDKLHPHVNRRADEVQAGDDDQQSGLRTATVAHSICDFLYCA